MRFTTKYVNKKSYSSLTITMMELKHYIENIKDKLLLDFIEQKFKID